MVDWDVMIVLGFFKFDYPPYYPCVTSPFSHVTSNK